MAIQTAQVSFITTTQLATLLVPVTSIEEAYFKGLTAFPDNQHLRHVVPRSTNEPLPTSGRGIVQYVPQPLTCTTMAQNFQPPGNGFALNPTGVSIAAASAFATTSVPYIDLYIEQVTQETNPYYVFGVNDLRVDGRLISSALTVVKDVIYPIDITPGVQANWPSTGKYKGYRFIAPFDKDTSQFDIFQFRVSYPTVGNSSNPTPTATYRARILASVISSV